MPKIIATFLLLLITIQVQAGGRTRCFCQPYQPCCPVEYPPIEEVVEKVDVITRQLKITPTQEPDKLSAYVVDRVYADVLAAIEISPKKDYMKKFEFVRNWPTVPPAKQAQKQEIRTETVTRFLYGQVQQNIVVQDGILSLDVSQEALRKLLSTHK